ncbi:MAG: sigma-70 family RNA polymerase sigma factor [Planctomycetaceae bacterium]|jgi:RNA polymerase sigma factor (sigma-70 family)|nr:sigma-70 family RNA polymerase sigma factor [Planctomycetaceae bacterium]
MKKAKIEIKPLTEPQQKLVETHWNLAMKIANKYIRVYGWRAEEVESAALFGLCIAASKFDPSFGCKFTTFATYVVTGHVKNEYIRESIHNQRFAQGDLMITVSAKRDQEYVSQKLDTQDTIDEIKKDLSPKQQIVFGQVILQKDTFKKVSAELHCGTSYVEELKKNLIKKLRNEDVLRLLEC